MTQSPDKLPYWQRPVVRVDKVDPLAEPKSLKNLDASHANGSAPSDIPSTDSTSQPEIADPLADASDSAPDAVAQAAEPLLVMAAPPPTLSVVDAQTRVVESQMRCQRAIENQKECRGRVALALERLQRATMQTTTFEQLAREHIAASNQERADRAAGKIPVRRPRRLGSAVDQFAFFTKASGRGAGGGRAFSRKAYPAAMRGRVIPKSE